MSESSSPRQPLSSLSVGNVVSAGLRIYRDRFKLYFSLALQAYLWLIVPVYGWAKFSAILGLISRLAYSEIVERPETVKEARQHTNTRMWSFLLAGLLVALIFFGAIIAFFVVAGIVFTLLAVIAQQNPIAIALLGMLGVIFLLGFLFGYIWLYSRLSIVELPIAMEMQGDPTVAIGRSWTLTQGYVIRLQLIFFVAFLLTLPPSVLVNVVTLPFPQDSPIIVLINLSLGIVVSALLIPFWQAIKAVIYYDLRTKKEGIDLDLQDTELL
jgi:hypothetical protein